MKTKKVKNIESTINPFNPLTQFNDYIRYEKHTMFIETLKADDSKWDMETAIEWLNMNSEKEYAADIICNHCNETGTLERQDLDSICAITVYSSIKGLVKKSADGYILDLASGKKPHDMEDLKAVALESLLSSLSIYWKGENVKLIDLDAVIKRKVRRQNVVAWNHVFTESDYTDKEKTIYGWMKADISAYIQSMRGVRVPVPKRVKLAVLYIPIKKHGRVTEWKETTVDKVVNNSVYFQHYSTDDMTDSVYYRMKASAANTDSNDNAINGNIALLAKRMKAEKVLTTKQLDIIERHGQGDSFRTIAKSTGRDESTIRESYNSAWKKVATWLTKQGYGIEYFTHGESKKHGGKVTA